MFLLVSVVLIDFLTITLISQCDELAVWIELAFKVSLQLSNAQGIRVCPEYQHPLCWPDKCRLNSEIQLLHSDEMVCHL